jgi:DNA-directed RNA polymerase specialized sigma24 family protein
MFCNPEHQFNDEATVWIREHDEHGRRANPRFVKAAYELSSRLLYYRHRELRDRSRAAEFLDTAVHAASHADHREPVGNFAGYLVRRFTGIVDAFLKREKRIDYFDPQVLADRCSTLDDDLERIENHIRLEQVMAFMDPETRCICVRVLDGYSMADIARELGVTPNALYLRFRRGCKKAIAQMEADEPRGRQARETSK